LFENLKSQLGSIFQARPLRSPSPLFDVVFHGDKYLLSLVDHLAGQCKVFVETGSNVGSTLRYVARMYPGLRCLSCEPDGSAFEQAKANAGKYPNVTLFQGMSQDFIAYLKENQSSLFSERCFFWLDAHGYGFEWPLEEELDFITQNFHSGYILIDDFKVPGRDQFGYDVYQHQICSFDYVKDSLNPQKHYRLFYPAYTDRTSAHHPLRGWGLLVYGCEDFRIPEQLADKIEEVKP